MHSLNNITLAPHPHLKHWIDHLCSCKIQSYSVTLKYACVKIQQEQTPSTQKGQGQQACGRKAVIARLEVNCVCVDLVGVLCRMKYPEEVMTHSLLAFVPCIINYEDTCK